MLLNTSRDEIRVSAQILAGSLNFHPPTTTSTHFRKKMVLNFSWIANYVTVMRFFWVDGAKFSTLNLIRILFLAQDSCVCTTSDRGPSLHGEMHLGDAQRPSSSAPGYQSKAGLLNDPNYYYEEKGRDESSLDAQEVE